MPASTSAAHDILDLYLRGVAPATPTRVWMALHTGDPGADGTANEVSAANWPSYARQDPAAAAAIATGFSAAAGKASSNLKEMLFPENDGAGNVTITHVTIRTHLTSTTAATCKLIGTLIQPKTAEPGDQLKFKIGEVDWSVE
ncbi:hypothetical protein SAMN05216456_1316 [Devosia crocina]|uniref:Uncharacterized protein n=1 Tax=Devosia crocina TaxID=429728 RepID=A0A1I7N9P0_9HYPH|nr:hypothetical protein [Devosia crocina]SFV31358.1 hypothetical protein SAMN05216456_1316 [Devosia crocina]